MTGEEKATSGFFDGLASSKKLGLVTTFSGACVTIMSQTASQVLQIALLSAAALTVVAYVVSQAIVEAAWGKAQEEEENPVIISGTVTTNTTPKAN